MALAYTAIFTLCALLGLLSGLTLISIAPVREVLRPETKAEVTYLPKNGQRNILMIGVDRLDVLQPRLEGLWLVVYFPDRSKATFLPLFPAGTAGGAANFAGIEDEFKLDETGAPDPGFLRKLQNRQIWWTGYILFDEKTITQSVDDLGGLPVSKGRLPGVQDGAQAVQSLTHPWQDPDAALQGQTGLVRSVCSIAANSSFFPDLSRSYQLVSSHIRSDFEVLQYLQDWIHAMGGLENLECEFPLAEKLP